MAIVTSVINLKGGVGKTTTVLQLADCLTSQMGQKVLVIDLDPQTNSTISLIGEERWQKLDEQGQTVAQIFQDSIDDTSVFNTHKAIQHGVSNLGSLYLDLLPSSLQLIDIQDRAGDIGGKYKLMGPNDPLRLALKDVLDDYDYVLIDCPPNLGFITMNGLSISDYYLIPTIPDAMSTYGIPQIVKRVGQFKDITRAKVKCLSVVLTKYQSNMPIHERTKAVLPGRLRKSAEENKQPPIRIFDAYIPQSAASAAAAVQNEDSTFKTKYGLSLSGGEKLYSYVLSLTEEFVEHAKN